MLAWMKTEPDKYNVARIGRKNECMPSWFASHLMQNRKAGLLMRRIGWRNNMMIIAIGFKNREFNDNGVQYANHGMSPCKRIHMTGSRLYDCIMQACEHDDDIDDACNGITDLIRVIIIALPSLPKGVIAADWISENMMHPIEFNIE